METQTGQGPDWAYWGNLLTVRLREALQLSLGLDPHSHIPAIEPDMSIREHYWNRLLITKNHAPGASWVVGRVVRQSGDIDVENTEVHLRKFAGWMINETTLEPFQEEFSRLARSEVKGMSTQSDQSKQCWTQRPAQEFIEEKRKAGSYAAAGRLHGVSRQRYTDRYKEVVEKQDDQKSPRKGLRS